MDIEFKGYNLTNPQKEMLLKATSIALDSLISKRMKKSLILDIRIEKNLYEQSGVWGDILNEDGFERSPKHFEIRLNYSGKQSFATLVKTLCHELVHVAQFAERRLRHLSASYAIGFLDKHYNSSEVDYDDRPWEIEAHELEEGVFEYVKANYTEIEEYFQKTKGYEWGPSLKEH